MEQVTVERTQKYLIVKIPMRAAVEGRAEISSRARRIIDRAVAEGLADITSGRVFGPFSNVRNFKAAIKRRPA